QAGSAASTRGAPARAMPRKADAAGPGMPGRHLSTNFMESSPRPEAGSPARAMPRMANAAAPAMPDRNLATTVMNPSAMPDAVAPAQADQRAVRRAVGKGRVAGPGREGRPVWRVATGQKPLGEAGRRLPPPAPATRLRRQIHKS